jgi:hypothetical protein
MEPGPEADLSSSDLFARARDEIIRDDESVPACLVELHSRPTRDVFDKAAGLLFAADPIDRILGARVLRELGPARGHETEDRPFKTEATVLLLQVLASEADPVVIAWANSALGYHPAEEAVAAVAAFADHPDVFVRFHVAAALPGMSSEPLARETLEQLATDVDPEVRYYALSGLIEDLEVPAASIEDLLRSRLSDTDEQVRTMARAYLDGEQN